METGAILLALTIMSFMALVMLTVLWLICRAVLKLKENARLAALYTAGQQMPSGPSFTLVYKEGKKQLSVHILANTEQEALAQAFKHNIRFDKVLSLTKN